MIRNNCRKLDENFKNAPITMHKKPLINKGSKIFTLGSCFALEIAKHLKEKGYNVLNEELTKETDHQLIWYNTYSILYEFQRAYEDGRLFRQEKEDIWKTKDGKFQDPYRRCVFAKTKERLWELIDILNKKIKTYLAEADCIVITLGLTEVWVNPDNSVICASPGYPKGIGGGQDCSFLMSNYNQNLVNIENSLNLLKQINPNCQVVLTVSPVALAMTFRNVDHVVANMESKSILRAVAGKIEEKFDNVTYFPSYEMAICEEKSRVFKGDNRHVKPEFVARIMKTFERHHVK